MNLDYYRMNRETQAKIREWARERGWETPSTILKPLLASLLYRHRLSLISEEIDGTIDRMMLLSERIQAVIEENNLVALLLLKERQDEELNKLVSLQRLLDREGPMPRKTENGITDEMIQRAKDYPFEDLLPEGLKRGRCRCPIHAGQNTMSFSVKGNRGRCWSCGWEGDTIKFVQDVQGLTFPDAVRRLSR